MTLEPGFRRAPAAPFDPDSVPSRPKLVAAIRAEIEAVGPIPFARFMERALYEPGLGYYRAAEARPGRHGDFLTAPESHPIVGGTISRQVVEVWERLGRPDPFVVREPGAGTGALALGILDELERDGSTLLDAIRYHPVEVDQRRLEAFEANLVAAGHAGRFELELELDAGDGAAHGPVEPFAGITLANEVLDAFPVHRVVRRGDELRERLVDWRDGGFVEVEAEPTTAALAARLAAERVELVDDQVAEIALGVDAWVAAEAARIGRGALIVIDYGHPAAELYGPRRRDGTLRAYVRHHVHADPFRHVGRQDLTAHVDVTAIERAAGAAGLDRLGVTTQAEFLLGCGLEQLLERIRSDPATTPEAWLTVRSVVFRLLDPGAMGRFVVAGFGRGVAPEPPLRGFAFRAPRAGG